MPFALFSAQAWALLAAFAIGGVFGWVVFATNFCAMGGISDALTFGDRRRLRAWFLAIATAILSAQALHAAGVVDLTKSMYLTPTLDWAGTLAGGLLFGFGMVFAGGCASKNLVRTGGGDLRAALVLLVMGVSAFMMLGGLLGPLRAELTRLTALDLKGFRLADQGLAALLAGATGLDARALGLGLSLLLGGGLALWCLADRSFRASRPHVFGGLAVGLCVAAGWAVTGLGHDELAVRPVPPQSLTFVRPTGDTLDWLMRFTAQPVPAFGVVTVFGTLVGAHLAARRKKRFRIATFANVEDTLRNLGGAVAMGVGGITALGCTMGQAVTGVSTLALGSLIAFAGILGGGVLGVKALERRLAAEDFSI